MIEEGPLILAVNHSSYFDPPLAGICSRRAVYYLARKNLLEWPRARASLSLDECHPRRAGR